MVLSVLTVLECLEDAEEEALSGRGEEVDAIEIGEASEGGGIEFSGEPLAGIAAQKGGLRERRVGEEMAGEGLLAGAGLALDRGDLDVRRGHFRLREELTPDGAYACELRGRLQFVVYKLRSGVGGLDRILNGGLKSSQGGTPPWPEKVLLANRDLIGVGGENMNTCGGEAAPAMGRMLAGGSHWAHCRRPLIAR